MDKDLETLINKTGCMNDTCGCLRKCLEGKECWYNSETDIYPLCDDYNTSKRLDNKLNAIDIIKDKYVDLMYLRCCFEDNQTVERYNEYIINNTMTHYMCKELTEEEFNTIKEVVI